MLVERDRRVVAREDPGLDRPDAGGVGATDELFEERPAGAPAAGRPRDGSAVLASTAVTSVI